MNKFILMQIVLLSIIGIGCAPQSSNTSANTANMAVSTPMSTPMQTPIRTSSVNQTESKKTSANTANMPEKTAMNSNRESYNKETYMKNKMSNSSVISKSQMSNSSVTSNNLQTSNTDAQINLPPAQTTEKKDEGLFSFPPPRAIDSAEIPYQSLLNSEGQTTFASVSQKLAEGLEKGGYTEGKFAYFWNNDNEFAIVTKMERINADGTPFQNDRWEILDNLPQAQNFSEYAAYLLSGKKVFYRVFAFIVTSKDNSFLDGTPPSFEMAKRWKREGKNNLGGGKSTIRETPFDEQYHCYALLYLFVNHTSLDNPKAVDDLEKGDELLKEGLNQEAASHLQQTGIKFGA